MSESISPAVVIARGSATAASLLLGYAAWLRENPYLLDHQARASDSNGACATPKPDAREDQMLLSEVTMKGNLSSKR